MAPRRLQIGFRWPKMAPDRFKLAEEWLQIAEDAGGVLSTLFGRASGNILGASWVHLGLQIARRSPKNGNRSLKMDFDLRKVQQVTRTST